MGAPPFVIAGLLLGAAATDARAIAMPAGWPIESPEPIGPPEEWPAVLATPPPAALPAPPLPIETPARELGSAIYSPFAARAEARRPLRPIAAPNPTPTSAASEATIEASPLNWALGLALAAALGSIVARRRDRRP